MTSSPSLATMALRSAKLAQWLDLIHREALKMTSALRPILSQSGVRSQLAKQFLTEFNDLLKFLRKGQGSEDFHVLLTPWKKVLDCQEVTGAFIHAALLSMKAFLRADLFSDAMSPLNKSFVQELMFSVANSRFETTVLEADEVVLNELIDFMFEVIQVSARGESCLVGDAFNFQFYDLLFVMLNQTRFSELLRAKASEMAVNLSAFLFSLSGKLESSEDTEAGPQITFPNVVKVERSSSTVNAIISSPTSTNSNEFVEVSAGIRSPEAIITAQPEASEDPFEVKEDGKPFNPFENEDEQELAPDAIEEVMRFRARLAGIDLGEPSPKQTFDSLTGNCLIEVLSFLARSIDCIEAAPKKAPGSLKAEPASSKVIPSPKTQVAALKCLIAIFSVPSSIFSRPLETPNQLELDLLNLIGDLLLKNLLAILALDHSSRHLSAVSQLLLSIFTNFRPFLLAQFEFFLNVCLSVVSNKGRLSTAVVTAGKPTLPRPTQLALTTVCLEMLSYFLNDASIISQIFVLYECSLDFPNTLEALAKSIAAGMEKSGGNEEISSLSGEILCNFIRIIEGNHESEQGADLSQLLKRRRIKMIYKEAAGLFNNASKESFSFLKEQGLLSAEPTSAEIAEFLRTAQGLDKKILGEYLVKPNNIEILREFFSAFHFSPETTIDDALRQVLESFRLPGEAQQIDRIMECFAAIYYPAAQATFANQDACYILAFSTLMLNTDLHNPQIKNKMSLPDFLRNNRGINDGRDVDEAYLVRLYHSIRTREIVMPEEHGGEEAFSSQWNEVHRRVNLLRNEKVDLTTPLGPLVPGIVEIVWKPIITSLIPFINQQRPTGEVIPEGPLSALRGIASLFEKFEMSEALEALLGNIWSVSNLIPVFSAASGNMIPRYLARLPGFRQVVRLIVDIYVQQAPSLKASWVNFCRLLIMFAESGLIEHGVFMRGDQLSCGPHTVSLTLLMKLAREARQVQPVNQKSFISSLSARFFGGGGDAASRGREPSVPEAPPAVAQDELVLAARAFVAELPLMSCLNAVKSSSGDSFAALRDSFIAHIKWNVAAEAQSGKRLSVASSASLNWSEETLIVLVEGLIGFLLSNPLQFAQSWPGTFAGFSRLALQNPPPPSKLCEHAIIGLGRLLLQQAPSVPEAALADFFKFWCQLSPSLQSSTLEPFLTLVACILEQQTLKPASSLWPSLFTILSCASKQESTACFTMKLFGLFVGSQETLQFPLDFFGEFVDLLTQLTVTLCNSTASTTALLDPWRGGEYQRAEVAGQGIKLLENVKARLPANNEEAWSTYTVSLLLGLSMLATQPAKTGRLDALNAFSRALPHQPTHPAGSVFSRVIFPHLKAVTGMPEVDEVVAMRSASMACKMFLLYVPTDHGQEGLSSVLVPLWKELLEHLHPLLTGSKAQESVKESVLESCKNVLLVMLSTPSLQDLDEIWRVTQVLIGAVVPEWRAELELRLNGAPEEAPHMTSPKELAKLTDEFDVQRSLPQSPTLEVTVQELAIEPTEVVERAECVEMAEPVEVAIITEPSIVPFEAAREEVQAVVDAVESIQIAEPVEPVQFQFEPLPTIHTEPAQLQFETLSTIHTEPIQLQFDPVSIMQTDPVQWQSLPFVRTEAIIEPANAENSAEVIDEASTTQQPLIATPKSPREPDLTFEV